MRLRKVHRTSLNVSQNNSAFPNSSSGHHQLEAGGPPSTVQCSRGFDTAHEVHGMCKNSTSIISILWHAPILSCSDLVSYLVKFKADVCILHQAEKSLGFRHIAGRVNRPWNALKFLENKLKLREVSIQKGKIQNVTRLLVSSFFWMLKRLIMQSMQCHFAAKQRSIM